MFNRSVRAATTALLCVAAVMGSASVAGAAGTYYVDRTSAACTDFGPGSSAAPYCTISAAASAKGGIGSTILVRPGIYREQVTVPSSGKSGSPFVFQATAPGVVVDGADDFGVVSRWVHSIGPVYFANTVTTSPGQVFADGARLTASTASIGSLPAGTFEYINGKGLYVNVGGDNPGLHQTLVGKRTYGFRISNRSYITIDGFTVTRSEDRAIYASSSDNIILRNNQISYANKYGIHLSSCSSNLLASNTISYNNDHGIYFTNGTTGSTVQDNESYQNARPAARAANGLHLDASGGNLIQRNRWHDNQDSGQHITNISNDNVSLQNRSWNNGDHGFDHLTSLRTIHVGDVAWHNFKDGFSIEGASTGTRVLDCIAAENGLTTGEYDLWVNDDSTSGLVSNSNIFWNSTSQFPIKYSTVRYTTISAFTQATGQDARSIQADPRFVAPAQGDFRLSSGSPAIDSADSSVVDWPATDALGAARVDDLSTPNSGLGSYPYADRGALEFLPPNVAPNATINSPSGNVTIFAGQSLDIAGTGSDPDGNLPLAFLWDFGGGAPNQTVEDPGLVLFSTPGVFTITFTVTDGLGLADSTPAVRQVTVRPPNQAPDGTIDAPAGNVTITAGGSVSFAGTGSDPEGDLPLSFYWNFGGGAANRTVEDPGAVIFNSPGTFLVRLTVTDSFALADPTPDTRVVTVNSRPPNGTIDAPAGNVTITAGQSVSFAGSASDPDGDGSISFLWDLGGGAANLTVEDPGAVQFNNPGTYTVRLTVTDSLGLADPTPDVRVITVSDRPPNGNVDTPAGNVTITAGESVSFSGTGSDPDGDTSLTFLWDFGGGAANLTVEDPGAVTFNNPGIYTVRLTVTDSLGIADPTPAARLITVNDRPPNGTIDAPVENVTIREGQTVSFAGTGSDPDGDTTLAFAWVFGGASPNRTVEDPGPVTFAHEGIYTVTFTVTDSLNLADPTPDTRVITVIPQNRPPNGVIVAPLGNVAITAGESVSFTGTGSDPDTGSTLSFAWNFGDGAPAQTVEDPGPVVFETPGNYSITFTVTDEQGVSDPTPDTRLVVVNPVSGPVDEIHWTFAGPDSVTFDWRGLDDSISYGLDESYGASVTGAAPVPLPFSSPGPFWEARIDGLQPGTVYHYAVGTGGDHLFRTPPAPGPADFTINVEGDVSDTTDEASMAVVQSLIAAGRPDFVLVVGDLSYANPHGQSHVDQHFNDVMAWSLDAAYMPAWGNHEWTNPLNECGLTCGESCPTQACDDLRNYKGRFALPNPQISPDSPDISCCGEDWYWFDYGQVRFIGYPEPWSTATLDDWTDHANALMDDAQANPALSYIVTFGHRPAYSSGHHQGDPRYQSRLDGLASGHPKYVLNLNGHSHDYERTSPQSGVVHVTIGTGGFDLEQDGACLWAQPCDGTCPCPPPAFSAFRAMRWGPLRLHFTPSGIEGSFICGPAGGGENDVSCTEGSVVDSFTIPPAPPDGTIDTPAGNLTITAGQSVSFGAHGADPNHYLPLSFAWDFGGGATDQTVEDPGAVPFNTPGTYTVRLTVTDSAGLADPTPDTRVITVNDRPPNGIIDTPAGNVTITAGESVPFTGSGSDADGDTSLSFLWTFGGGAAGRTVEDPGAVQFNSPGIYTVRLTVTDSLGMADPTPDTRVVTVNDRPPNGTIDTPAGNATITAGQTVSFTGTGSDPDGDTALTFSWDFGGGAANRAVEDPGPVLFNSPGVYMARLTVTDSLGLSDPTPDTRIVTVNDRPPNGNIDTPAGNVTVTAGQSVSFTGTGSDPDGDTGLTYSWNFGGGASNRTVEDPGLVAFTTPGIYTVTFTVTDSLGVADPSPDQRVVTVNTTPNLVANPSFETGTTGWDAYSAATIARVAGGQDGAFSLEITGPSPAATFGTNDSPNWVTSTPAAGTHYAIKAWVMSAASVGQAKLKIREYLSGLQVGTTTYSSPKTLSPSWQQLTLDYISASGGSTLDFQIVDLPVAAGEVFRLDNISIRIVP